jgi:hypothetical protein
MWKDKSNYENAKRDLLRLRDTNPKNEYMKIINEAYKDYKTTGSVNVDTKVHESVKNVNSYSTVYGELTVQGIELLAKIIDRKKIKIFMDIGSGNGKIPIVLALCPSIQTSFGVELVEQRHNNAMNVMNKLSKNQKFKEIIKKIKLVNDDMFNIRFNELTTDSDTLVFISNLCFGEEITSQLFAKLSEELPIGSLIASSKIPSNIPSCFKPVETDSESSSGELVIVNGTTKMPMTWIDSSTVHFYQLVSRC